MEGNDDMIPVITAMRRIVEGRKTLESIINNLQRDAAFYCCFLSAQITNQPNAFLIMKTLNGLDKVTKGLAEAYVMKAGYMHDEHTARKHFVPKTEEEYLQEVSLSNEIMRFAAELDPAIKLKKEHLVMYICSYHPEKPIQIGALILFTHFSGSTVYYVNRAIENSIILNRM